MSTAPTAIAAALSEFCSPRVIAELDHACVVVPRGVRHNLVAENECHIMLIEKKSTQHTGGEVTEKTRSLADQLRPLEVQ